jgi:hypothetical protein
MRIDYCVSSSSFSLSRGQHTNLTKKKVKKKKQQTTEMNKPNSARKTFLAVGKCRQVLCVSLIHPFDEKSSTRREMPNYSSWWQVPSIERRQWQRRLIPNTNKQLLCSAPAVLFFSRLCSYQITAEGPKNQSRKKKKDSARMYNWVLLLTAE